MTDLLKSRFSVVIPTHVKASTGTVLDDNLEHDYNDPRQLRMGKSSNQDLERRQYISTLLFVNEESILARQFARYFELKGFSTKVALDADETMSIISHMYCDVVVLDLEMASDKDWRLMKYIQDHPNMKGTQILLLGDRNNAEQGLALGAIDCLSVPTDKPTLHSSINSCLRNSARAINLLA